MGDCSTQLTQMNGNRVVRTAKYTCVGRSHQHGRSELAQRCLRTLPATIVECTLALLGQNGTKHYGTGICCHLTGTRDC